MTLAPDATISDRYTLLERIAVGGMGEVWRAHDQVLSRDVAVKVLKEEYAADPTFLQRFRAEARHTAALSHPGIANVFDYGEIGAMAFLVMELVHGEPLSAVLAREGPLDPPRTLDIAGQTALALQAAHDAGVVHRDVKPGNLLIRPDGVVKVTDFGIARAVDAAPVTQTGLLVGTAAYLSPEQAAGKPVTPLSDVYSLGVVTYECLSGQRPFTADSAVGVAAAHVTTPPPPLPAGVPPIVADFVLQALAKDPDRRQPSAGDFGRTALALAHQLRAEQAPAPGPTATAVLPTAPATSAGPAAATAAEEAERRRIRNIFIAVGAAVVVLGFLLLRACAGPATTYATVPKVTGETYARAVADLHRRGFTDVREHKRHSLRHGRGVVLAQSERPGDRIAADQPITVTVSTGPAQVTIHEDDYVGRPLQPVESDLRDKNLRVHVITRPATAPAGTVTAVDPTGPISEGATVTVTVAVAPTPVAPKPHGHGHGHGHDEKHGHGD